VLAVALLLLQYRLWFSGAGAGEMLRLKDSVATQQADNQRLSERNRQLAAEVRDLKQGYAALEERARTDLGMIGSNETFFQVRAGDARASAAQGDAPASPRSVMPASPAPVPPAESRGAPGGAADAAPGVPQPAAHAATTLARATGH
jgi:cell division protein FtsB